MYYKGGNIKPFVETLQELSSTALLLNGFFEWNINVVKKGNVLFLVGEKK